MLTEERSLIAIGRCECITLAKPLRSTIAVFAWPGSHQNLYFGMPLFRAALLQRESGKRFLNVLADNITYY